MTSFKGKTCMKGHAFDAVGKDGRQCCKTCERDRLMAWRERRKNERKIKANTSFLAATKGSK